MQPKGCDWDDERSSALSWTSDNQPNRVCERERHLVAAGRLPTRRALPKDEARKQTPDVVGLLHSDDAKAIAILDQTDATERRQPRHSWLGSLLLLARAAAPGSGPGLVFSTVAWRVVPGFADSADDARQFDLRA